MSTNTQKVVEIPVKKLILWTENPRDVISPRNNNKAIIKQALEDKTGRWEIKRLSRDMGPRYDFSELPTVVYNHGRPIVYDGNRRVILAMLKLGLYKEFEGLKFRMPECPEKLPCCVTSEKFALDSIWRKHGETGSWDQISRDVFLFRFRNNPKSVLLQLDDMLKGKISTTEYLNQRFVRDEVLVNPRLKNIGIKVEDGKVLSRHNSKDTKLLLGRIFSLVKEKKLSTRVGRTAPLVSLIGPKLSGVVRADSEKKYHQVVLSEADFNELGPVRKTGATRLPRRVASEKLPIFGGKLDLKPGKATNLYLDILRLYENYESNKDDFSDQFPAIVRMALRLECELIAKRYASIEMGAMAKQNFDSIKSSLSQEQKTYLSQNAVSKSNVVELLQTSGHVYEGNYNMPQTLAMSLIVGGLLKRYCARCRG